MTCEECLDRANDCQRKILPWWQVVLETLAFGAGLAIRTREANAVFKESAKHWTALAERASREGGL